MIAPCEDHQMRFSELLDEELRSEDRQRLESHLATCGECRALLLGLVEDQKAMARVFSEDQAATPFPEALEEHFEPAAKPRSFGRVAMLALAAGVLLCLGIFFGPGEEREAEMGEVLAAVAGRFEKMEDVEYRATLTLPALEILKRMFSKDAAEDGPTIPHYRILARPERVVIRPEKEDPTLRILGFDGTQAWVWTPEKRKLEVYPRETLNEHLRARMKDDRGGMKRIFGEGSEELGERWNLLEFLSWRTLFEMDRNAGWVEVTNAVHRKGGLRAFTVREEAKPQEGQTAGTTTDLTIVVDPKDSTILTMTLDARYRELPVLRAELELLKTDQGVDEASFQAKSYVPADVQPVLGVLKDDAPEKK